MNPYIEAQRKKYDSLRENIKGLQTRAVTENRDLTEDELRSVTEQGEQAKTLATQIEDLTEIETRNRKVAELAVILDAPADGDGTKDGAERTRGYGNQTKTLDRDPGHYRPDGKRSFFSDMYRSREFGDQDAARRLVEHHRALKTPTEGVGTVPPKWLTDEFDLLARQGRIVANAVRYIPLGDDPRPMTLPKQTAGTDTVVADQVNEGDPVSGTDAWDSDVDLVSPKPIAGKQIVTRQMLDMSTPAIDLLIYGDLMEVYNDKVELKVGNELIAAAGAASVTFANEAGFSASGAATDSVTDLATAVRNARKRPATLLGMTVNRWGRFKKLKDSTGRPIIPSGSGGAMNVFGVGSVNTDGIIEELPVIVSDAFGNGSTYPESYVAFRASDTLLFESNMLRFRFEEQAGPESVVLGVWGYVAVKTRQVGKSVKRAVVTAAV